MIPNIIYNILRSRSNDNQDNNQSNTNNEQDNEPNNNPNNNPENNTHAYDGTQIITPQPLLTSQGLPSNIRFGAPVCILRAPSDLNIPPTTTSTSTQTDENPSRITPFPPTTSTSTQTDENPSRVTSFPFILPPNIPGSTSRGPVAETAKINDKTSGGIFGKSSSLHVIPVEGSKDLYKNRISYNTQTDSYYENGDLSNKYLRKWKEGVYQWDNIELKIEHDWEKTYLARQPTDDKMNDDGEISWKFDYRNGSYLINSLKIKLIFGTFDNLAKIQWFIKPLPTLKTPIPDWQLIPFDPYTEDRHTVKEIKDLTQFVKGEYGFILKVHLSGGISDHVIWQKTQLFRQNWSRLLARSVQIEDEDTFGLDINVELKPDIIIDSLPELSKPFVLNDKSTSDFVINYETSTGDKQSVAPSITSDKESEETKETEESKETKETKVFHVHSEVLSKRSDYFNALLDSRMIESQNKTLTLTDTDISYDSLEIILNYLYTGTLPKIDNYDEWVTLLHYASRFLVSTLIQECEKELKGYTNDDNMNDIKTIAVEYGAEQLSQYCENFELPIID